MDDQPAVEHVYILQEREFLNKREPVYKIGQTRREAQKRFQQYSKSSDILECKRVRDSLKVQEQIKDVFKIKFLPRRDIGTEYFEGNILEMVDEFDQIVREDRQTPEGNINCCVPPRALDYQLPLPQKNPDPLTIERIRELIPFYTHDMVENHQDGMKKWILKLIYTQNGPNLKCTDRDKPVFIRLNEKGRWVKGGDKFMNNIFKEVCEDGNSLLQIAKKYWLELMCIQGADDKIFPNIEDKVKKIDSLVKILENEKRIRSRFLKEILMDIAYERYPKEYIPTFDDVITEVYTSDFNDNSQECNEELRSTTEFLISYTQNAAPPNSPASGRITPNMIKDGLREITEDLLPHFTFD